MSYRRSRSRREFESQIENSLKELAAIYGFAQTHGAGSRLLAAYYIFSFSQFEVYIKEFVEDSVGALNSTPPSFENLPDLMLGYMLHKNEMLAADYRKFGVDEDEGTILRKVAITARKVASWTTGTSKLTLPPAADVLEKKKYPSPKNFPQLFKRLGIPNIWVVVDKEGKMDGKMILTSLNDLRTDITHEGKVPTGFSLGDFQQRIKQMQNLVRAIDRGVSSHFCTGMMKRNTWNALMA